MIILNNQNFLPEYDKLYKIRPVIESVLNKCRNVEPEQYHAVDEQMIPIKTKNFMKQYLPKKPHKWGFKVFSRYGSSGIIYAFQIYTGKSSNVPTELGITGNLVMRLCANLPKNQNYKLYFDNFFTSSRLLKKLKNYGMHALGTIRLNRMKGAQKLLESKKALKSKGRGSYDWRVDCSTSTMVIRWKDNNVVHLASTFIGNQEEEPLKRWCAKERVYKFITCPKMMHEYNYFMGGVDLCDMFLSLYRI